MIERQYDMIIPFGIMDICGMYYGEICWGERLAQKRGWLFYRVSAKTGANINETFEEIVWTAIKEKEERALRVLQPKISKPKRHCCIL